MVDYEAIFQKYNIPTAQSGRHKRPGYSNVVCHACTGNEGFHRGFCHETGSSVCFRCGSMHAPKALAAVLRVDIKQADRIIKEHTVGFIKSSFSGFEPSVESVDISKLNLRPLVKFHKMYLEQRGYNVERLVHFFGLKSTGINTDPFYYQNKIFIPYYLNNQLMTYSTRDISVSTKQEDFKSKYITCKKDVGLLPPNFMIFNFDNIKHRKNKKTLFLEGPFDCAKFPEVAGGLSGIKFPPAQVKMIVENFNYPVFLLDPDSAGQEAAQKAFDQIEVLTGKAPEVYSMDGSIKNPDGSVKDPGDFTYEEVDNLLNELEIEI